jgi:hypothetical protein
MALMVERIVDGGVHAEEALGGRSRLDPLHLALSPSHDLVGVLGPIIFVEPLVVTTGQMEFSETLRHRTAICRSRPPWVRSPAF